MRGRARNSSYLATTTWYKSSGKIPDEKLDHMVTLLRAGNVNVIEPIIQGHVRLVSAIVSKVACVASKRDDALGAALLSLTQAVLDARTKLHDNNITAYITTTVRYAVKTHLSEDHIVRVPGRTIRYRIEHGEVFEEIVPGDPIEIREDVPSTTGIVFPFTIPIAKSPDFRETMETRELVTRAAGTPTNEVILTMRLEGFGYAEIGNKIGLSVSRLGQIVPELETRLKAIAR